MSQAAGVSVSFFELDIFLDKDPELAKTFLTMHGTAWILLVISVTVHAGTVLHQYVIKTTH